MKLRTYRLTCRGCREIQEVQASSMSQNERRKWVCGNCRNRPLPSFDQIIRSEPALMDLASDMGWAR
jgi:hypothetical protein